MNAQCASGLCCRLDCACRDEKRSALKVRRAATATAALECAAATLQYARALQAEGSSETARLQAETAEALAQRALASGASRIDGSAILGAAATLRLMVTAGIPDHA